MVRQRRTGATILAVIQFIVAFFAVSGGLLAFAGGVFLGFTGSVFLGAIANIIGAVFLVLGLASLVIGWGFWTGKGWAWFLGMLFALIGILTSLVSVALGTAGSIVGLLLNAVIVYYLTRPHVKFFFGKGSALETIPAGQTT